MTRSIGAFIWPDGSVHLPGVYYLDGSQVDRYCNVDRPSVYVGRLRRSIATFGSPHLCTSCALLFVRDRPMLRVAGTKVSA